MEKIESYLNGDLNLNLKYNKSYLFVRDIYGTDKIQPNQLFSERNQIINPREKIHKTLLYKETQVLCLRLN